MHLRLLLSIAAADLGFHLQLLGIDGALVGTTARVAAVLLVGRAWLVVGFVLAALARGLGVGSLPAALHAFSAGAIGTLILAVTTRASLGHSGRDLEISPWTVLAYGLITAGSDSMARARRESWYQEAESRLQPRSPASPEPARS